MAVGPSRPHPSSVAGMMTILRCAMVGGWLCEMLRKGVAEKTPIFTYPPVSQTFNFKSKHEIGLVPTLTSRGACREQLLKTQILVPPNGSAWLAG